MTKFKELSIDSARSVTELGRFWAAVTGCAYAEPSSPGEPGYVVGELAGMSIAIAPVPEEKTVKHRVHLDVHTDSVDSLLALGARRAPGYGGDPWTVLLDPEGGEFCAFVREDPPAYGMHEVIVDAVDHASISRWWADVFGVPVRNDGDDWSWIEKVPGMPFDSIVFQSVPEPKTVKNRIHWDVYGDVEAFTAAGATVLAELPRWTVMADPEGNEFCVFQEGG